jgi:hypothetical protein
VTIQNREQMEAHIRNNLRFALGNYRENNARFFQAALEAICCGAKDPVGVAQGALTMLDDEFRKEIGR